MMHVLEKQIMRKNKMNIKEKRNFIEFIIVTLLSMLTIFFINGLITFVYILFFAYINIDIYSNTFSLIFDILRIIWIIILSFIFIKLYIVKKVSKFIEVI